MDLASAELCMSMHLETAGGELWCLDEYLELYWEAAKCELWYYIRQWRL